MKKILITLLFVSLAALLVAGVAFAQANNPPQPAAEGTGVMQAGRFGGRAGMRGANQGLLQPYVLEALANALDIPLADLQAAHDAGQTMWSVAEQYDISSEALQTALSQARQQALEAALADGVISADQAAWMNARMNQAWPDGYGPGSQACDGTGTRTGMGQRGGGRGRQSQP